MERAVPHLPGDDLEVAKDFYQKLGFSVAFEETEDGRTGILGLERGTMFIILDCPMPGHGKDACVSLEVESTDDCYEAWRDKVRIDNPPKNEYWGARTFGLQDPFGNTVFVVGPLTDA